MLFMCESEVSDNVSLFKNLQTVLLGTKFKINIGDLS